MEPESRFVTVDGKTVHYVEMNTTNPKDTLVLLHGMSFKAETWSSIGAPTKVVGMGINYLALDYPGWGESEKNEEFYPPTRKYSNAATFIEEFTTRIGLKRFSLVGASFSGPFVISYASRHPESINKIVLVGPVWSEDLSQEASLIVKPVLIMYGENDNVISSQSFIKYGNSIRGSKLVAIRRAGHALYLDNSQEFFRVLEQFLL